MGIVYPPPGPDDDVTVERGPLNGWLTVAQRVPAWSQQPGEASIYLTREAALDLAAAILGHQI